MPLRQDQELRDVSGTRVWLVLMKAHRAMGRVAASSINSTEIGLTDFGVLEILLHKGPQPINDIGRRIGITSGAITTAVDRLENVKMVTREAHPTDRRARVARLTDQGKRHVSRAFAGHKAAMDEAAGVLTVKERAELIRLLKKLGLGAEQKANAEQSKE